MSIQKSFTPDPAWIRDREKPEGTTLPSARVTLWRGGLIGSCLAAVLLGSLSGDPATLLSTDPDLARLLRGMALIKGVLALATLAIIWWRYSRPLSNGLSTVYLVGVTSMVFAAVTVWQLSHLAFASILFHAGIFMLLGAAYLDTSSPADTEQERQARKRHG